MSHSIATAEDAVLTETLGALAHELRTPLTALRGFADLLTSLEGSDDALIRREITARLVRNTKQLEALVDNMLEAATHGQLEELHPRRVSLRSLAHDVVDDVALSLGAHHVEVHGESAFAFADPYAVTRILMSLLINAARYSPDDTLIDVETSSLPDGRVLLSVSDEGPGIPEAERESVFHPFWRGERARERVPGLGVGLSIARDLCVLSGGDIHVGDARGGHGARFDVILPAAP